MFNILSNMPYDSYVWSVVSIIGLIPAIQSYILHRQRGLKIYRQISLFLSIAMLGAGTYALSFAVHGNPYAPYIYAAAEFMFYLGLSMHAYMMWYLILRPAGFIAWTVVTPFISMAMINSIFTIRAISEGRFYMENYNNIIQVPITYQSSYLKSILAIPVLIIGMYFLSMINKAEKKSKIGYLNYGILYFFGGGVLIVNSFVLKNNNQGWTGLNLFVCIFLVYLLVKLINESFRKLSSRN